MADNNKPKLDLPWGTLLPLLAVLAGVIATYKPLVSERPSVPSENTAPVIAAEDVDARLWQDPVGVAQKQKALLDEQIKGGHDKDSRSQLHDISALAGLLEQDVKKFSNIAPVPVLLLAVMLDAGPYSEQAESRLRARQAVLEGLSESGFTPVDGEHIGFVTDEWPRVEAKTSSSPVPGALLLPWEECEANEAIDDPELIFPKGTKRVVVLWLPAANFNVNPLRCFAALINQLAPDDLRNHIDVRLIGPANSAGLKSMVKEAYWYPLKQDETSCALQGALDGAQIISPRATVPDFTLLSPAEVSADGARKCVEAVVEESIELDSRGGLHFVRTIAPDDQVLSELIAELAKREIVVSQITPGHHSIPPKLSHIVILSEWDTPYGRSLGRTFAADVAAQSANDAGDHLETARARIHPYDYLRGIDGRLPGDVGKDNQPEQLQKTQLGQNTVAIEATEGLNQSDYLRRLARQMKEDNARLQREEGSGIRAIGLLGQDIYGKLMILRALRPQFPNAVFFTNNYDAHFERRDDWGDTHNLIIASPFGSALPETYIEGMHIPPFRDTNQTSMYVGTLVATGRMTKEEADFLSWQPRIFEVSRHGAYDLSEPWYLAGKNLSVSNKTWFRDWLFAPGVIWLLVTGALALLAIVAWISVTIASPTLKGGGTTPQRLRRVFASTTFCLVCGVPLIVFLVAMFAQYKSADIAQYELGSPSDYLTKLGVIAHVAQEPLAFFSGISIWPSEMLRLIALMLAIHFMVKAGIDLRANERELGERFSLGPLPKTPFCWHHLGLGLEQWHTTRSDESGPEPE